MLSSKELHQLNDPVLISGVKNPTKGINAGDCLIELENRYLPLIKSLVAPHFIRGMDFEDWLQEAMYVMIKVIRTYKIGSPVKFGVFYRRCLRNWFYDLVRIRTAKKRVPSNCLTSYNANQEYYDNVLKDMHAVHPERIILTKEFLEKLMRHYSQLESTSIVRVMIEHQSPRKVAKQTGYTISQVKSALARCKYKFSNLHNRWGN